MSTFTTELLKVPVGYKPLANDLNGEASDADIEVLVKHFGAEGLQLPVAEGSTEKAPLSEREIMWLSKETFARFLIDTKNDVGAATKRVEEALTWRRSVNIEDVDAVAAKVEEESKDGPRLVQGFTKSGRPLVYLFPNRNKTRIDQRNVVSTFYILERARDLMPAGVSSLIIFFNFGGTRQGPPNNVSATRDMLNIISTHYPGVLAQCYMQDLPFMVKSFINLVWPFVDQTTKAKTQFGSSSDKKFIKDGSIDASQVLTESGGDLKVAYDHATYWPALIEACKAARNQQEEKFRQGPSKVGRSEAEWRAPVPSAYT